MKKITLILSFLALLFSFPKAHSQDKEKPVVEVETVDLGEVNDAFQEHFFEALKQKAIENYEKAIDELVQCLAIDDQPVVYLELGKNFNALQKYSQAAAYLEKGRAALPGNTAILEELYKSYFLSEEFEKALPVVKTLATISSSFSEDLANLYILNEKYEETLSLLDSLDARKGSSTNRDSLRRQVYARTNNVEAQIQDLEGKIAEDPEDERNYLNLIFVYSENGRVEEAFEAAKQLLEKKPSSELVHLALYKFYLNENRTEEAVNSLRIVLGSGQVDEVTKYQALNDFLMFVAENPSLEEDLIELVKVFSEDENNTKVYKQLGTFFLEKRKTEPALKYFQLALESSNADFGLYKDLLGLQLEFGKYAEAIEVSSNAIEIFPAQPLLYLYKGRAQNRLGDFSEAEEALLTGLDFIIDDLELEKEFYREMAKTYEGLQKPGKASEYLKKADEIEKTK
jgi:tetratricopeptide (TPR) repeat protein